MEEKQQDSPFWWCRGEIASAPVRPFCMSKLVYVVKLHLTKHDEKQREITAPLFPFRPEFGLLRDTRALSYAYGFLDFREVLLKD